MKISTTAFTKPAQTEAEIQDAIMAHLEKRHWLVVRINGINRKIGKHFIRSYIVQGLKVSAGFPDVLALKKTRFVLIECKTAKGEATESQMRFARFAARFGVSVYVVRDANEVDAILKEVEES